MRNVPPKTEALKKTDAIGVPPVWMCFLVWTMIGTLSHIRYYVHDAQADQSRTFWPEIVIWLTCFYPWALLTPLVFRLEKRFLLQRPGFAKNLSVLATASVVFACVGSVAGQAFVAVAEFLLGQAPGGGRHLWWIPISEIGVQLALYWSSVGASYIVRHFDQLREREREADRLELEKSRLEASLKEAELETLRMRLNPHFLFNTLQNISVLAKQDPRTASQMLTRLGDLLRVALRRDAQPEVALEEEIGLTRTYLEVEQMRFGERLTVEIAIAPGTEKVLVPTFLLQPLVENAIKHGLRGKPVGGRIAIQSAMDDRLLTLSVKDNGTGVAAEDLRKLELGIGLGSTCERLARMYAERGKLAVRRLMEGGTEICVTLPLRWSESPIARTNEPTSVANCR